MDEVAQGAETLTGVVSQVGPLLEAAAGDPITYAVAVGIAVGVYFYRKRKSATPSE